MQLQDIAELLVASWVLSREGEPEPLPTSHGLLDRALARSLAAGAFPQGWRDRLHFVDSRIGLQCVELQSVISAAQRAEFTSEPNPSYEATRIKISPNAARRLLRRRGLDEHDAVRWGAMLHESVDAAKAIMKDFPSSSS